MRLIDADKLLEKAWDVPYETEDAHYVQVVDVGDIEEAPTIQPQGVDKDRVEHVIKVLEFCKQRHIDISIQLPHTVDRQRDMISCYEMALKVVRECLLQPYKESE